MLTIENPLVSVQWLHNHINDLNLIVLDASMHKVTELSSDIEQKQIPGARFFDIKNKFSEVGATFPNKVPSESQFIEEARNLGINKDSAIVVYDDKGIYSCGRAWYLFKAFGFDNIAVLDGGLPEWKAENLPTEEKPSDTDYTKGNFEGSYHPEYFQFFEDMVSISVNDNSTILDARANNRFLGLVDEPREGLRAGHIPKSMNLPFADLMNGNRLKPKADLQNIFIGLNIQDKQLVFSCGSGITACILALAAEISDYKNTSIYDGSWTEYGTLTKADD